MSMKYDVVIEYLYRQVFFNGTPLSFMLQSVYANVAQMVEHSHGKGEVIGSIPIIGSRIASVARARNL